MARHRVYVAGAYDGPDVCTVLGNMRRGIMLSKRVLDAGYAPFCPWLDFLFGLVGPIDRETYLAYSMAWLEASEAIIVVPQEAATSRGTQAELARADELGIPIFGSMVGLGAYFRLLEETDERSRKNLGDNNNPMLGGDC